MRILFIGILCAFFVTPLFASAHIPLFVEVGQHDATTIQNPEVSKAYYGELNDFPHLFEISSEEEFELFVEILVPDIAEAQNDVAGIVLSRKRRGVDEITRLSPSTASWEPFFEWVGGDSYRRGPSFTQKVPPGDYAIEVSTVVNKGKYVLVVGKKEEFDWSNYMGTLRDIARVKEFFGKSSFGLITSLFVYVPLLLLVFIIAGMWYWLRMRVRG